MFTDTHVKEEVHSPIALKKEKKIRVVRKLVERPKTVYERFPAFQQGKVLDFTELFEGYIAKKSRVGKRPFQGNIVSLILQGVYAKAIRAVETVNPRMKELPKNYLKSVVGATKRQVETKRVEEQVAAGSVEDDLRQALEVRDMAFLRARLLI
jgi:transcription initiation factor TFIID subunit 1